MIFVIIVGCISLVCCIFFATRKRKRSTTDNHFTFYNKPPKVDIDTSPFFDNSFITKEKAEPYIMVLDTETSQLTDSLSTPSMPVAISWLLLDKNLNVLKEKSFVIKQSSVSSDATFIHKITQQMIIRGHNPRYVIGELIKDINTVGVIVAHNLKFHLSVIDLQTKSLSLNIDITQGKSLFCTMLWATENNIVSYRDRAKYPSLTELFAMLYFNRYDVEVSFSSKTRRDLMLILACLRTLKHSLPFI